ncbi:MAG: peptide ABC transporter substrate-binding protein [Anaerolineales bacterium]
MKNLRWEILIAVGGLALVVGLLLGQGPTPASDLSQPVQGGVYTEGLVGTLARLDPILDFDHPVDRDIDRLIYSGLVQFDSRGIPSPDLAQDWAVSADARLYTFTIREDAVWHDGEPVTADDVVYTFSLFQDPAYPGPADLHEFWDQVTILRLDPKVVQFELPEPFAPFLDYVSVGLLPDHLLRGVTVSHLVDHPFHTEPVGTGPFRFSSYLLEGSAIRGVSLEAFQEHVGARPFLERIEFRLYDTPSEAMAAYDSGLIQGFGSVDASILPEVLAHPGLSLYSARVPRIGVIFLNLAHAEKTILAEKQLRQALLLSLNREWMLGQVFPGQAVVASGPILPGTWADPEGIAPVPFDAQRAAEELDALEWTIPVGAAPGTPEYVRTHEDEILTLQLAYPDEAPWREVALLVQESWASLGVRTELVPTSPEAILSDYLEPRDFEAVLTEMDLSRFPDPDPYPFWHDSQIESGQNYSGFNDRNTSIWLEQARITPDLGQRAEFYRSFLHRFQDQVPALLLYYPVFNYAVDSSVQGISLGPVWDPSDRFSNVTTWHLLARRGEPVASPPPTP